MTVTLNTTVLSLGEDGRIPNKATVFTNDNGGKTTTKPGDPTTDPKTNWGPLEILKHAAGDKTKTLAGAEFAVYTNAAATGTPVRHLHHRCGRQGLHRVLWVGSDDVTSARRTTGSYYGETKAPAGYVLDETIHKVAQWVNAGSPSSAVVLAVANTPAGSSELAAHRCHGHPDHDNRWCRTGPDRRWYRSCSTQAQQRLIKGNSMPLVE